MNGGETAHARIRAAFIAACHAELQALKPGNVHIHAAGHDMTVRDFEVSAEVAAAGIAEPGARVGRRILSAVTATRAAVGTNTNLGIVLLAAPLARAAERTWETGRGLRAELGLVLADLDRNDAADAFEAIRIASPGGLGRSDRHDVSEPPRVTLLEAMAEAAGRDRIARQYVTGFDDVFNVGLTAFADAVTAGLGRDWATVHAFFALAGRFPDTHVARKHGLATAERIRSVFAGFDAPLTQESLGDLLDLDAALKRERINPGTTADLTVASVFASLLLLSD